MLISLLEFTQRTKMSKFLGKILANFSVSCRRFSVRNCVNSLNLENKYSDLQKKTILKIINETDTEALSRYSITKLKVKKIIDWRTKNGVVKSLSDIETIDGFTEKYSRKLCDKLLEGKQNPDKSFLKIKGQVLHPAMPEAIRKDCKTVLALYVTVSSVCWALIDRCNYEVVEWKYKPIEYPDTKGTKITDILSIAWHITDQLPMADVNVMKAEATSLRASGSDPNNPKVLAVNLQKAQMIAMIVAFINARSNGFGHLTTEEEEAKKQFQQKVYFLRPTLPFRLYGTLVGNERVSTDQTVEMILQECEGTRDNSQVYIPDALKTMFRSQNELQKDMLGHCLLLALTFMDVCVYKNRESIEKLVKRGE